MNQIAIRASALARQFSSVRALNGLTKKPSSNGAAV